MNKFTDDIYMLVPSNGCLLDRVSLENNFRLNTAKSVELELIIHSPTDCTQNL